MPERKRVLLFQLPLFGVQRGRFCVPQGLLSIAGFLERHGHECAVYPLDFLMLQKHNAETLSDRDTFAAVAREEIKSLIEQHRPHIVGTGVMSAEYRMGKELLAYIKTLDPDILTVIGGPHVTFYDRECLSEEKNIDVVVRREGEWTLLDLVNAVARKQDFAQIPGCTYRDRNGEIIQNPERPFGNLEDLPLPDYTRLPRRFVNESWIPIVFSRGCPFNCHFCQESVFWGHRVRGRTIASIIQELSMIADNYDNQVVALQDSLFNSSKKYCSEICRELKTLQLKLVTYIHLRTDFVSQMLFRELRETGMITAVSFGIESASPRVLKFMNKKSTVEDCYRACRMAKEHGFDVHTLWIIGHPGDSPKEFQLSLDTMRDLWENKLHDGLDISIFYPYPGTYIYENREKLGIRMLTSDWEDYASGDNPVCELEEFSAREIMKYLEQVSNMRDSYLFLNKVTRAKTGGALHRKLRE